MKVLLEGGFLDRKENLLIFGNPGAGKSHLLRAIAQELIAVSGKECLTPDKALTKTKKGAGNSGSQGSGQLRIRR